MSKIEVIEEHLSKALFQLQKLYDMLLDEETAKSYRDPLEYYRTVNRDIERLESLIAKNRKRYVMVKSPPNKS